MKLLAAACALACAFTFAAAAAESGAGPTDAQIAAIVVTANQVDIDAGKLAKATSQSKDVQTFAQLMITDHSGVNKSATELVTKLHVTPESNPTSESLKQGGEQNLATLRKLQGHAFDQAYVDHEVAYHQAVLDAVDQTLIPNAKNAELQALLVKVRPAFVAHLEHAKHLQASLSKSGT
jgi:putative membrane protein